MSSANPAVGPLFELYVFTDDLGMAHSEHRGAGAALQKCRPAAEGKKTKKRI